MKKLKALIMAGLSVLMLAGCSLPFAPSGKQEVTNYVKKNEESLLSSHSIDERLLKTLKTYAGNEEGSETVEGITEKSIELQQKLYDDLKKEKAPNDNEKMKYLYLDFLNHRIVMYKKFTASISIDDKRTLMNIIETYEELDKHNQNRMLEEVNVILGSMNADSRVSLTEEPCDGEECNKKKK